MNPGSPVPLLNRVRAEATRLLDEFEAAGGSSPDPYRAEPVFHAMAAGKYLGAMAALVRTGLLSPTKAAARAAPVLGRLGAARLDNPGGGGAAWGLGFEWGERPADEPYLVTSAVVARGLAEWRAALGDATQDAGLADAALEGIASWVRRWQAPCSDGGSLPAYSRSLRLPVYNAAALAQAVLLDFLPEARAAAAEGLHAIWRRREPGLGWCYDDRNGTIDLVHQAYLLRSMRAIVAEPEWSAEALTVMGHFEGVGEWRDALFLGDEPPAAADARWARRHGRRWLLAGEKRARLWSLGESLATLAPRPGASATRGWDVRLAALADNLLRRLAADPQEAGYFRHGMHAAEGLARMLEWRRSATRSDAPADGAAQEAAGARTPGARAAGGAAG